MKNGKTHFIFDFDDTLADSYHSNQQLFVEVFRDHVDLGINDNVAYLENLHKISVGKSMISQFQKGIDYFKLETDVGELLDLNEKSEKPRWASSRL